MSPQEARAGVDVHVGLKIARYSCEHDVITAAVGAEPSYVWTKGVPPRKKAGPARYNMWVLWAPVPKSAEVEDAMSALFDMIPDRRRIAALPEGIVVEIVVGLTARGDERPSFHLPAHLVRAIAEIGAEFDADIYDLRDARPPTDDDEP